MKWTWLSVVSAVACSDGGAGGDARSGTADTVDTRPPLVCVANLSYACECAGVGAGRRECLDGLSFGSCGCGGEADGGDGDAVEVIDAPDTSEVVDTVAAEVVVDAVEVAAEVVVDTVEVEAEIVVDTVEVEAEVAVDTIEVEVVDTVTTETTPRDVVDGDALVDCPLLGTFGGHVFHKCGGATTRTLAAERCALGGATLIRRDSLGALAELAQAMSFESWVTATRAGDLWQWDGFDVGAVWCAGQPDGQFLGAPDARCVLLSYGGCLDDAPCDTVAAGIICEL